MICCFLLLAFRRVDCLYFTVSDKSYPVTKQIRIHHVMSSQENRCAFFRSSSMIPGTVPRPADQSPLVGSSKTKAADCSVTPVPCLTRCRIPFGARKIRAFSKSFLNSIGSTVRLCRAGCLQDKMKQNSADCRVRLNSCIEIWKFKQLPIFSRKFFC